jgi:hypothetical protein
MSQEALTLRIDDLQVESFSIGPSDGPSYQMDGGTDTTYVKITLQTMKATCEGASCGMFFCAEE